MVSILCIFPFIGKPVGQFHGLCVAEVAQDNHSLGPNPSVVAAILDSHMEVAPIHLDSHTGVAAILLDSNTAD